MSPILQLAHATNYENLNIGVNDLNTHDQCSFLSSSSSSPSTSYAPWYKVSHKSIVSVEHLFIIKNTENGVASLGGPGRLQEVGLPLRLREQL